TGTTQSSCAAGMTVSASSSNTTAASIAAQQNSWASCAVEQVFRQIADATHGAETKLLRVSALVFVGDARLSPSWNMNTGKPRRPALGVGEDLLDLGFTRMTANPRHGLSQLLGLGVPA